MAERDESTATTVKELVTNCPLRSYLVTYSKLDYKKFPTRWSFGGAVVEAFGANNVDYFVASKEPHLITGEYHYHVAIRLCKTMRWKSAKDYLKNKYDVVVNFSTSSDMYIGAYRYVTKMDKCPIIKNVLRKHPNLDLISHTYNQAVMANNTFCNNKRKAMLASAGQGSSTSRNENKPKRLKKGDVAMFVVKNAIHDEISLIKVATERRDLGDRVLYDYLIALRRGQREELVTEAWRFENAEKLIAMENVDILQTLNQHAEEGCRCNGLWLTCAKDVLERNGISYSSFATAVLTSFEKGRQKHVNIMLVGPANCGKTFLFKPVLKLLPNVFMNPASSTFGWMGVEKANLILLNDLRWKPRGIQGGNIDWCDFLNLLEGMEVSLPAPMNTHCAHLKVIKQMPILATSIAPVTYWITDVSEPQTSRHHEENFMMSERWNTFKFTYQFTRAENLSIPDCTVCFAKFVLQQ